MTLDAVAVLLDAIAPAHERLHEGDSVWRAWQLDPELLLPVALGATLYVRGLVRWRDRSRRHSAWRVAIYFAGLATLLLALGSPLDALSEHHFSMHMIQHEVVMMVAVPLILLGAPTTPVLKGMPRAWRRHLVAPLMRSAAARSAYRLLTQPAVVVAIFTAQLWAWHFAPGWYEAALDHRAWHGLQHLSFAGGAWLVWWTVIDPAPLRARIDYLPRLLFLLAVSTPKHLAAAFITLADRPLFTAYEDVRPIFGTGMEADQQLGGVIMWAPSQMMFLATMAAVFFVWAAAAERREQREDAEREAQRRAAAGEAARPA